MTETTLMSTWLNATSPTANFFPPLGPVSSLSTSTPVQRQFAGEQDVFTRIGPSQPYIPPPIPQAHSQATTVSTPTPQVQPTTTSAIGTGLEIPMALAMLRNIRHSAEDEAYLKSLGINLAFRNGQEAYDLLQRNNIEVSFGFIDDAKAHAAYDPQAKHITINDKYQGDFSPLTLYAIAEAIYHEAGHAAGNGDGLSSIQEELDCLALNTLAHRFHTGSVPAVSQAEAAAGPQSELVSNGVALYTKLFFDPDPTKQALVDRVILKYGDLPPHSPGHDIPTLPCGVSLAYRVLNQLQQNRTQV